MKVTLDREGKNVVKLEIELEPERALKAYEMSCRRLSHQVNIPGFRRGKAPRNILEKNLGVDYIKNETLKGLINEMLDRAISDENLDVITYPEIDSYEFELGKPLLLKTKFEVRPEVQLGAYSQIEISVPEAQLPADALERALTNIAESKAGLQTIDPRPVKDGDVVLLDFECYVDDKLVEGGKAEGLILDVKEGAFLAGFPEQLIGHTPGEQFAVNVRFPDEYRNKELAGKEATFKVNLREIREKTIPNINDELASSIGYNSLDELTQAVKERLDEETRQENMMRLQRAVVDKVVSLASVDVPESMIERERELLVGQLKAYFEENKQNWEEFQRSPDYETVRQNKFEEARQRVLTSLVLGAIVRAENLTVNEEEISPYLEEMIARYNLPAEQAIQDGELRRRVMEEILTSKVVEFLINKAIVTYTDDKVESHSHDLETSEKKSEEKSIPKKTKKKS